MFNSQKRRCSRKAVVYKKDAYNQDIPEYLPQPDVEMFISLRDNTLTEQNDMRIQQSTHIALTTDGVNIGDIISDTYEVTYVNDMGRELIVFMRDRNNADIS